MSAIGKLSPELLGHVLSFLTTRELVKIEPTTKAVKQEAPFVYPIHQVDIIRNNVELCDSKPTPPLYNKLINSCDPEMIRRALNDGTGQQLTDVQLGHVKNHLAYLTRPTNSDCTSIRCRR